jgi:hypothetical protein
MNELKSQVDTMLNETEGFLELTPNFVTRYYMDHTRLGLGKYPGDTYQPEIGRWMPITMDCLDSGSLTRHA